jgi:hypothetical protein
LQLIVHVRGGIIRWEAPRPVEHVRDDTFVPELCLEMMQLEEYKSTREKGEMLGTHRLSSRRAWVMEQRGNERIEEKEIWQKRVCGDRRSEGQDEESRRW